MSAQIEVLASEERAVDTYTKDVQVKPGPTGIAIYIDITVHNGGTLTVTIYDVDPVSGQETSLLASSALSGSNQAVRLMVHPQLTAAANSIAKNAISDNVRIKSVVATAAVTFSLGMRPLR
jgi:hypothetical protein